MEKLITITSTNELNELLDYLKDKEYVAVDTETTGLTEDASVIGYSLCAEPNIGYYVVTKKWDKEKQLLVDLETIESTPDLLRSLIGKKLLMHNGIFDCAMINRNYKVELIDSLFCDTMVLAHLIDENRSVGLKELGQYFYGDSAKKEQQEMKESVIANGGELTKKNYELYKADFQLIAKYGAKDTILTYNLFYELIPQLYEENMEKFFFDDESMPLLKGPTYQLNTSGLMIDKERLGALKLELQKEIQELKNFIYKEIHPHIKDEYPETSKKNTFNIGSSSQLSWLLFHKLGNTFVKLSDSGRELYSSLGFFAPYTKDQKSEFAEIISMHKGELWNKQKIKDYWAYLSTDKVVLSKFAKKYEWMAALLKYKKLLKLLNTYVEGIESQMRYGIIHPSFLQTGTTSGRYSSRNPNFQNLPRSDKRIKKCIVARPGKVFVGADYSQLEPRVFSYYSNDARLLDCFQRGMDFYSVIGTEVFNRKECSLYKEDESFFGKKYAAERDKAKVIALSATYGTTANKLAPMLDSTKEEAQGIIDNYFDKFPDVESFMQESHELAKKNGYVENYFGRKRRIPEAKKIGDATHFQLTYEQRNLLNLAVNHRIQSTGASIINRASIRFLDLCKRANLQVRIVLQVHDELVVECEYQDAEDVKLLLQYAMETTVELPGVKLIAEPKIAANLADLK